MPQPITVLRLNTTTNELTDGDVNTCFTTNEEQLIKFFLARETIKQNITTEFSLTVITPNVTKCTDKTMFIAGNISNSSCNGNSVRSKCELIQVLKGNNSCNFLCDCEELSCELYIVIIPKSDTGTIQLCEIN